MKKICMILIALGIIMGCATVETAYAQETGDTKDTVKIYHSENAGTICEIEHIYYAIVQYQEEANNHAYVIGTAPGAPSVLEIPSSIDVNGVHYSVTDFAPDDEDIKYYGLPSNKQIFEEIKLPDSVVKIQLSVFGNIYCKKINVPKHAELNPLLLHIDIDDISFVIPEDHDYYTLKDNFVYDKKDSTKIHYVLGVSGDVRIPEGVKYVGSLLRNSKIEKLSLPSTVEKIDSYFAAETDKLKTVDLSATKLNTIPEHAFTLTKSLQEIKLPSALLLIDYSSFDGSGLKKVVIPNKVTKIESYAFANCDKLKKVTLGKKLKIINSRAFSKTAIQEIAIPESVKQMEADVFAGKNLQKVTFMHRKKLPKFTQKGAFKNNRSSIKFYVKNQKMAKQLKKNLKKSKVKKAKIYAGNKKKLVYKNING